MRNVKKVVAVILALGMMFALNLSALAEERQYTDVGSVTITKVYKLEGEGTSPAETFTLMQVGNGTVKDGQAASAPALGTITGAVFAEGAATAAGAEAKITVELPVYEKVGIYEYTLREVAGTTAGVSYYGNDIKLVVTVINDASTGKLRIAAVHTESIGGQKSDSFPNTYAAGKLNITKSVTGNLGDKTRYFKFKVTLTGEAGKTYAQSYAVSGGSYAENPSVIKIGEETTLYLKHDETLSIANLPYGVSYVVEEETPEDYTLTSEGTTGSIRGASTTAAFTNHKGGTPDTGITLDSMPYVLMLTAVVAGALVLTMKKRSAGN